LSGTHRRVRQTALLLAVLCAASTPAEAQSGCGAAFTDSLAVRAIHAFDRVAAVAPVWDDYTVARHPLLLLADSTHRGRPETPVCAAIWRAGAPLEIVELAARPRFTTPLFGMLSLDSIGRQAIEREGHPRTPAPAVADELRARGVTRAVVLAVPLDFARLGRLGEMLAAGNVDPALMQADLAVHEGFHLHAQFPHWYDQPRTYAWPAWDRQPDRGEAAERCYTGSPELASAFQAEQAALVAAFDASDPDGAGRDTALAVRHARRFVELRAARRRLQDTITVARGGGRISCELAEDLMELEEGSAMWLGHATTVRAGLTTRSSFRGSYAGINSEPWYQTGPLQLWVLEGLLGSAELRRMTASIARSAGPDGPEGGIFARFEHQTRLLADPCR
jgi:hypothetical protein